MKVKVLIAPVDILEDEQLYASALRLLPATRRNKIESYRFEKDRRLGVGAFLLLRHAVISEGLDPAMCQHISFGAQGKPYFEDSELHFSLSHSGSYALCAVSECETGCDVEKLAEADLRIARRFFHPAEYEDISSLQTSAKQNERFYRYWALKESFLKATGLGMKLPMNAFELTLGQPVSVKQSFDDLVYSFSEYDGVQGYRCAVCVADSECPAEWQAVDLRGII